MSPPRQIPFDNPDADPIVARAERQMRIMQGLCDVGMDLARALTAEVTAEGPVVMRRDPGLLFARISRAVRQCIALEIRIAEAVREWQGLREAERLQRRLAIAAKAGVPQAGAARPGAERGDEPPQDEDLEDLEDGEEGQERAEFERAERLTDPRETYWADRYVIEDEGSFLDIVARVCRDLDVEPATVQGDSDGAGGPAAGAHQGRAGPWRQAEMALTAGPMGRTPPQRGPPGRGR